MCVQNKNIYAITAFEPKWQIEKPKLNCFYLFLYDSGIQKRSGCKEMLTLILCTECAVHNKTNKKTQQEAHKDKIQGISPDLSGSF